MRRETSAAKEAAKYYNGSTTDLQLIIYGNSVSQFFSSVSAFLVSLVEEALIRVHRQELLCARETVQ